MGLQLVLISLLGLLFRALVPGVLVIATFGANSPSLIPEFALIAISDVVVVVVVWLFRRHVVSQSNSGIYAVRATKLVWVAIVVFSAMLWYVVLSYFLFVGLSSSLT